MISVIIPTCHRNHSLADCLDCLAPGFQTLPKDQYEVIVTDDGKRETAELLLKEHYPWAKWVKGHGKGPAANRNNGVKYAQMAWLAFTDDDCLPDKTWLEAYKEAIYRHPDVAVFEGRTYAERPKKSFAEFAPINEEGGNHPSCNFMASADSFRTIKGFDEQFSFSFEDIDFFYRLTKAGYRIKFVKDAGVCHPWRKLPAHKLWRNHKRDQKGLYTFIFKHTNLIGSLNTIHFLKIFCVGLLGMPKKAIQFKGSGFLCEVRERLGELEVAWALLPGTVNYKFRSRNSANYKPRLP